MQNLRRGQRTELQSRGAAERQSGRDAERLRGIAAEGQSGRDAERQRDRAAERQRTELQSCRAAEGQSGRGTSERQRDRDAEPRSLKAALSRRAPERARCPRSSHPAVSIRHSTFIIVLTAVLFLTASAFSADPTITSLSPASANVGLLMTLTVNGTNFVSTSIVKWNGSSRSTTYVSATVVRATILDTDLTATGTAQITVVNPAPALVSNAVSLPIVNPAPTIISITPSSVSVGAAGFDVTVYGTGFISSSVVQWGGQNRPTAYVSATQIKATISAADVAQTGLIATTVTNPTPGGGTSAAKTFTVNNPLPNLSALFPASATVGGPNFILEVQGSNFVSGSVVKWKTVARATTFVSGTLLRAAIPASDLATGGTAAVTVFSPTPGGGTTAGVPFSINNPVPAVSSISPTSATALGSVFTLTVNGSGFATGASVQWNGVGKTTTYVSPTQLTAAIPAADIATGGMVKVGVVNVAPGGGNSTTQDFTIDNPVPSVATLTPSSANAGGLGFSLTVDGANFVTTSLVYWNGVARATARTSATRLVATIPASDIAVTGTATRRHAPAPPGWWPPFPLPISP